MSLGNVIGDPFALATLSIAAVCSFSSLTSPAEVTAGFRDRPSRGVRLG